MLCSSLAWQQREKQRIEEGLEKLRAEMDAGIASAKAHEVLQTDTDTPINQAADGAKNTNLPKQTESDTSPDSQLQVNLNPSSPYTDGINNNNNDISSTAGGGFLETEQQPAAAFPDTTNQAGGGFLPEHHPEAGSGDSPPTNIKPPRIYYATRTHSQIAQVVAELKRSGYTPRMAVLGSKQHYCVNSHARGQKVPLEQVCDELLKESSCIYFKGVAPMLNSTITKTVHDIEDLANAGKKQKGCPYYVSRKLAAEAELVFGPYNYLVDPVICRSLSIELENSIIIFDEAHNIEDVAREAASLDLERFSVMETLGALKRALQYNKKPQLYEPLCSLMDTMLKWMEVKEQHAIATQSNGNNRGAYGGNNNSRFEPAYEKLWQAQPMMDELTNLGLGPDRMEFLWETYQLAREEDEAMVNGPSAGGAPGAENKPSGSAAVKAVRVGAGALGVVSRLIQVVRMVHEDSTDGGRDYRLVVKRTSMSNEGGGGGGGGDAGIRARLLVAASDTGNGSAPSLGPLPDHFLTFSLWCLNPAVAFRKLEGPTHSIILTSGTLSPMDSFASELGTDFPIKLEAPHVVNMAKQVWAGAIGTGPNSEKLLATYQHTDKTAFQDAVGSTILQACRTIPDGLLLFLPSYSLLDKLCARWKVTGMYSRIDQTKPIVREPRTGGGEALQAVMTDYYAAIAAGRGGLFMAVCRGKVSEGLDFADANARGVIVVGIPFPNIKDSKVDAKRKFNDNGQRTLGLLPGSVWYEQQAFRALNQAVGRCIRHRGDWGAIILLDERFQQAKYQKGLSRWLRGAITPQPSFQAAFGSMGDFFTRLQADPPAAPVKLVTDHTIAAAAGGAHDGGEHQAEEDAPKVDAFRMLMAGHKAVRDDQLLRKAGSTRGGGTNYPDAVVQPAQNVKEESQQQQQQQQQPTAAPFHPPETTNDNFHMSTTSAINFNTNSLAGIVRRAPLHQIIPNEVAVWSTFAMNQGVATSEIDAQKIAITGIFDSFDLAANAMNMPVPRHDWLLMAHVAPPWGVQAVLSLIPYQIPADFNSYLHYEAVQFAGCCLSHVPALEALGAMREAYEEVLRNMYPVLFHSEEQKHVAVQPHQQQQQGDVGNAGNYVQPAGGKRKWQEEHQADNRPTQVGCTTELHSKNDPPGAVAAANMVRKAKETVYAQALQNTASDDSDF